MLLCIFNLLRTVWPLICGSESSLYSSTSLAKEQTTCCPAVEVLCWTREIIFPVSDGTNGRVLLLHFSLKAQSGRNRLWGSKPGQAWQTTLWRRAWLLRGTTLNALRFLLYSKAVRAKCIAKYPVPANWSRAFKFLIIVLLASQLLLFKLQFLYLWNSEDKVMDRFSLVRIMWC